MGVQVSGNNRDEANGGMTPERMEDRCVVVKGRKEARYVTGRGILGDTCHKEVKAVSGGGSSKGF